jgi:Holliday junction resolvase RusA-like endonuclease
MAGGPVITLPWPNSVLRPNAHLHWRHKAKAAKTARTTAFYLARSVGASAPADGPVRVAVTFHQPDKRRRDMDGCISQCKAYFDGIADALRVDDRRFVLSFAWGETAKPGRVEIMIGGGA